METFAYLGALLIGLTGLALLDWRYRLAFWFDWRRSAKVIGAGVLIFIVWDALGILLGIFYHGGSEYSLPLRLAPEFPVEELFFLTLLCYSTLIIYRGVRQWRST